MMVELILAMALFVGSHLILANAPARDKIAGAIGEWGFLGLYSVISIVLLAWAIMAYIDAPFIEWWQAGPILRHVPLVLMPIAFLIAAPGYFGKNPTAVFQERFLTRPDAARGIFKITRHPVSWGVTLWAIGHIAANGDAAAFVLFGGFLILTLVGMPLMDRKKKRKLGADWDRFAAETSLVPFAAILEGRARVTLGEIGWWKLAAGLILYAALLWLHPMLFGVSPLPR